MLRPLNNRVLIRPEKNPDETESGLILPENRAEQYCEMRGTVVSVGTPTHPRKMDAEVFADWLQEQSERHREVADLLRDLVRREPCVQPGDYVLFSWSVGQEITIDDERFLLMTEDDLLAVLEMTA